MHQDRRLRALAVGLVVLRAQRRRPVNFAPGVFAASLDLITLPFASVQVPEFFDDSMKAR
jgi:hypothetical protein